MKTLVVAAGQARGLIEEALQRRGHDVVVVGGVEAALKRQRVESPALIVIAAASCAMDGLSGCAALRENASRSDTTILYVGDGTLEALAALDSGADDHLPLDADGLDLRIAVAERTIAERGDHRAMIESRGRYELLFDRSPEAVLVLEGGDGLIAAANDAASGLMGRGRVELLGSNFSELTAAVVSDDPQQNVSDAVQTYGPAIDSLRILRPDGSERAASMTATMIPWGRDMAVLACLRDVTERKNAEDHLRHEARFDELTGLFNRRYFLDRLAISLGAARRHTLPLGLCLCDVDEFKQVNDTHGHAAGDSVLRKLGGLIRDSLRAEDLAGRLGGDEFCLAFPYTRAQDATVAVERLRAQVASTKFESPTGVPLRITISFGLADAVSRSCTIDSLLEQADRTLYRAKREGRNRVLVAD